MADTVATTRPSRARKAAPAKAAPAKAEPAAPTDTTGKLTVEFDHVGPTKNYERFDAPANMKGVVVGSIYAPMGSVRAAVVIMGPVEATAK